MEFVDLETDISNQLNKALPSPPLVLELGEPGSIFTDVDGSKADEIVPLRCEEVLGLPDPRYILCRKP